MTIDEFKILGQQSIPDLPWEDKPAKDARPLWRYSCNPVIARHPIKDGARAFNSAAVYLGGGGDKNYVGVFRVDHHNAMPRLHFGKSRDGISWNIENDPITFVDEAGKKVEPSAYQYDPRVVKVEDDSVVEDVYFVTWCNEFAGTGSPTICAARTVDFVTYTLLENAFPPFNRNGVLFPRKIGGRYAMLHRPSDDGHTPFGDMYVSYSPDMTFWGQHRLVMRRGTGGWWESCKIGPGPAPIETSEGWLAIYHAVIKNCNGLVYSFGTVLLDRDDPSKVLARSNQALLTPETQYEAVGYVPNVCFPCAALCDADTGRLAIYYGAADTYTAVAFGRVEDLVKWTKANSSV